jgi:hypothetical protein
MRIEREDGTAVGSVWAVFSRREAEELRAALSYYFEEDPPDPGWHCHFGAGDSELTVAVALES